MAKQSFLLDPNAQAYTDNEIVGKINSATATITRTGFTDLDKIDDGSTKKSMTDAEKTKLSGVETGATADQTGTEIRDAVVALSDTERKIVITEPTSGEYKVISVQRDASGKAKISYDDQAVP